MQTAQRRVWTLTKNADIAGSVDGPLQCSGNRVSVGDQSDVCGLVVELGASAHCPRRMKLTIDAARFDAERQVAALRVGVVELNQLETTARVERVLAQQKLRPGPNLASTKARRTNDKLKTWWSGIIPSGERRGND